MQLPLAVHDLDGPMVARWQRHFGSRRDRPRNVEEGLWRRTQDPTNADQSLWKGPQDARRRLLHYRYRYALDDLVRPARLVLADFYLASSVAYPRAELCIHRRQVLQALADGGWRSGAPGNEWARGDLRCEVSEYGAHPQDERAGRRLAGGYGALDVVVTSADYLPPPQVRDLPWDVLAHGMRVKDRRQSPTEVPDLSMLDRYLPFQVEVGCGMSVEAGVPALHRLHEIYQVTNRTTHCFVLSPQADTFLSELLTEPEAKLPELVEMFVACFTAEPTPGHAALRSLADAGHIIGPVITNNFDGLTDRVGLEELYVRRYDQQIPPVSFLPQARALLVVGSHADRRRVQARARDRGMMVFFLDTEGFWEDGRFVSYPVEGARDGDVLCRRPAGVTLSELVAQLGAAPARSTA
ncbi:MAG: Sir2 family NAD-dependent protein deacetylase [Pseudonocardiaceae bacterium]